MLKFNVGDRVMVKRNRNGLNWLEKDLDGNEGVIIVKLENRVNGRTDCYGIEFKNNDISDGSDLLCAENPNKKCRDGCGRYAMQHEIELVEERVTGVLSIGDI